MSFFENTRKPVGLGGKIMVAMMNLGHSPVARWGLCHFKYRQAVMEAYPCGHYPVFEGYDHMQYQIRDPKGFAEMLAHIAERDCMPELPFIRK